MFVIRMFVVLNFIIILCIEGYPIEKKHLDDKAEKRYPNGTVIGKYTYKDREGNPIHVKYYADDSSYGVELKSLKVFDHSLPDMIPQDKPIFEYQAKTIPPFNFSTDPHLPYNNLKLEKASEILNEKKPTKNDHRSEYDIYSVNELKPGKCNGRVRVYYEKNNKRKIRNAFDPNETFKFCERL